MVKAKTKEAHIYLPPKVFEQLKRMAIQNRRSMNAEIIIAVEERIQATGNRVKK